MSLKNKKVNLHGNCVGCDLPRPHCMCAHLVFAHFMFGLGLLALLFAWIAGSDGNTVLGFTSNHLFHDATVFMLVALYFRRRL